MFDYGKQNSTYRVSSGMSGKTEKSVRPEKSEKVNWKYTILAFIGIIGTLILLVTGMAIFRDYRNALMKNQQDQLLLMAKTLSRTMSSDMENYINELNFFSDVTLRTDNDDIIDNYVARHLDFAVNVYAQDPDGGILRSSEPISAQDIADLQQITDTGEGISIWQGNVSGMKVLVFRKDIETGFLSLMIDEDRYYEDIISDIHIGSNGYIVIKNSSNLMLMHPSKDQWGINVISGRKEMYPELDYSSLEDLLDKQNLGGEGVDDYYSYWWLEEKLPKVRKISGYSPVKIGGDFWIVSAVVDYDDFYRPILEGFQGIILVALGIMFIFLLAFVSIIRLISANDIASHEINYLKNLNQVLEEMHRSENAIAHQQRLQIMGTMTGGIVHEFKNFLTPIMGHAELLMMSLPEDSEEYDSAMEIFSASEKARDVVEQMSAMSRKNVEPVMHELEAYKLVTRFFSMCSCLCPENVEIIKENMMKDEYILGNSTQINQVLLNIAVNGIQAIGNQDNGLLRLRACAMNATDIKARELPKDSIAARYLLFEIRDNGAGMSPKVIKKIYEPFFTTKKAGEGTGLGLSLAQHIVEEHKGFIHVDSALGEGSTFYVYFPIIDKLNKL